MIGPSTTSDELSASSVIITRPGFLHGFELLPPLLGTSTLKIYDSPTGASGKLISEATVAAGQNSMWLSFNSPRVLNQGCYAAISGSSTTYTVAFSLG
jgi:hypothetical protein